VQICAIWWHQIVRKKMPYMFCGLWLFSPSALRYFFEYVLYKSTRYLLKFSPTAHHWPVHLQHMPWPAQNVRLLWSIDSPRSSRDGLQLLRTDVQWTAIHPTCWSFPSAADQTRRTHSSLSTDSWVKIVTKMPQKFTNLHLSQVKKKIFEFC